MRGFACPIEPFTQCFGPWPHHAFACRTVCRAGLPLHKTRLAVSGGVQCLCQQIICLRII